MKKRYRTILIMFLIPCVLVIGVWMAAYYTSDTTDTSIHSAEALNGEPVKVNNNNSSSNTASQIVNENSANIELSNSYFTVSKELAHLRLVGTAVNSENAPCAVIDNRKTNSQGLYQAGDDIDGATIVHIHPDSVVLSLNEKKYKLILEKSTLSEPQLKTDELLQDTPNAFIYTTQDDVERAWDETQELMTKIEIEQYFENGEPKGVRIEKILPDSVFEKIGFLPGDILIRVDDMEMNVADDAMEIYNCIRTKSAVQFTVIREDEPDPLTLEYHSSLQ